MSSNSFAGSSVEAAFVAAAAIAAAPFSFFQVSGSSVAIERTQAFFVTRSSTRTNVVRLNDLGSAHCRSMPRTKLGEILAAKRAQAIAAGMPLYTMDEINAAVRAGRGRA